MQLSNIPYRFAYPWAANAATGYATDPVPATSGGSAASQSLGFPPITAQPIGSGGVPPAIWDFNGFGKYVTEWIQWVQAGYGMPPYDGTFQTNIGGYPSGAIIQSGTHAGALWLSTSDNNTTNPDTGGAGWVAFPRAGIQVFTTSGTFTAPAGVTGVEYEVWGGGGGAGGCNSNGISGPGGGGGYSRGFLAVVPGTGYTVTVGAGGSGGNSVGPTDGADGTASSFGPATCNGGGGGGAQSGVGAGAAGAGGTASGGAYNQAGYPGAAGYNIPSVIYVAGLGGGSFGCGYNSLLVGNVAALGAAGQSPGQGATGSLIASGGNGGANGMVIIRW